MACSLCRRGKGLVILVVSFWLLLSYITAIVVINRFLEVKVLEIVLIVSVIVVVLVPFLYIIIFCLLIRPGDRFWCYRTVCKPGQTNSRDTSAREHDICGEENDAAFVGYAGDVSECDAVSLSMVRAGTEDTSLRQHEPADNNSHSHEQFGCRPKQRTRELGRTSNISFNDSVELSESVLGDMKPLESTLPLSDNYVDSVIDTTTSMNFDLWQRVNKRVQNVVNITDSHPDSVHNAASLNPQQPQVSDVINDNDVTSIHNNGASEETSDFAIPGYSSPDIENADQSCKDKDDLTAGLWQDIKSNVRIELLVMERQVRGLFIEVRDYDELIPDAEVRRLSAHYANIVSWIEKRETPSDYEIQYVKDCFNDISEMIARLRYRRNRRSQDCHDNQSQNRRSVYTIPMPERETGRRISYPDTRSRRTSTSSQPPSYLELYPSNLDTSWLPAPTNTMFASNNSPSLTDRFPLWFPTPKTKSGPEPHIGPGNHLSSWQPRLKNTSSGSTDAYSNCSSNELSLRLVSTDSQELEQPPRITSRDRPPTLAAVRISSRDAPLESATRMTPHNCPLYTDSESHEEYMV